MPDTWITPRIWTVAERVGQSKMNEISNNLRVLYPYTAGGDLAYRSPSGDYLTALAKGSAYKNLRMNSGATAPEWGGYIAGMAARSTAQTISTGTLTNVQFTSAPVSNLVTWSSGDNTKLTIGVTGLYMVGFVIKFDSGAGGYHEVNIIKNGATTLETRIPAIPGDSTRFTGLDLALPSATDYFQLQVRHNLGSNLDLLEAELFAALLGV